MTAPVILMPVVPRRSFGDPAWREQVQRECMALAETCVAPPARTRPLLVIGRRETPAEQFMRSVAELAQAFVDSEGGR